MKLNTLFFKIHKICNNFHQFPATADVSRAIEPQSLKPSPAGAAGGLRHLTHGRTGAVRRKRDTGKCRVVTDYLSTSYKYQWLLFISG